MGERIGTAKGRELAEELRHYREILEVPAQELADRLGWSTSKISRVEHGLTGVSEIDVVRYLAHVGASAEGIDAILELCQELGTRGYWLTRQLHTLVFHENIAAFSASYDTLVVPGLLQTEEYATALIGADRPWQVSGRMERQRILQSRPFEFYIHEQALRLPVGNDRVMNEQLLKLTLFADQPRITVRVVPYSLGAGSMFGGDVVLFRYSGHRSLVYLEQRHLGIFLEDEEHVSRYKDNLASISEVALGRGESRELLAALASEFDRPEDSRDAPEDLAEEQLQFRT